MRAEGDAECHGERPGRWNDVDAVIDAFARRLQSRSAVLYST